RIATSPSHSSLILASGSRSEWSLASSQSMIQYAVVGLLLHDIYRLYQLPDASVSRFVAPSPAPSVGPTTPAATAAAASGAKSPPKRDANKTREA
ncbi:hypothetical protein PFISCL1PPCAC_26192, partial [Pristionchus fissidentatus]